MSTQEVCLDCGDPHSETNNKDPHYTRRPEVTDELKSNGPNKWFLFFLFSFLFWGEIDQIREFSTSCAASQWTTSCRTVVLVRFLLVNKTKSPTQCPYCPVFTFVLLRNAQCAYVCACVWCVRACCVCVCVACFLNNFQRF